MEETKYGRIIQDLREEKNMTQEELAYLSMVSPEQLQKIEQGKPADSVVLQVIANVLGVYSEPLEKGEIVKQQRTELQTILKQIEADLREIGKNDTYIKEFLESYGIDTNRFQVRPISEIVEETYVIFDTLKQEYVMEDGKVREWTDIHDVRAYADNLNLEASEVEEHPIHEAIEESVQEPGFSETIIPEQAIQQSAEQEEMIRRTL